MSKRPLWFITLCEMISDAAQLIGIFIVAALVAIAILGAAATYLSLAQFGYLVLALIFGRLLAMWYTATYTTVKRKVENEKQENSGIEKSTQPNLGCEEIRRGKNEERFQRYAKDLNRQASETNRISDKDFY